MDYLLNDRDPPGATPLDLTVICVHVSVTLVL